MLTQKSMVTPKLKRSDYTSLGGSANAMDDAAGDSTQPSPNETKAGKTEKKCMQLSEVWNHYSMSKEDLSVICKLCGRNMKRTDSSTKSMWGHLSSFHSQQVGQATFDRKRKRCTKPKVLPDGSIPAPKEKGAAKRRRITGKTTRKTSETQNNTNMTSDLNAQYFKDASLANIFTSPPYFSSLAITTPPISANIFDLLSGGMTENTSESISPSLIADEKSTGRVTKSGSETRISAQKEEIDPAIFADQYALLENIINLAAGGMKMENFDDFSSIGKDVPAISGGEEAVNAALHALLDMLGAGGDTLIRPTAQVLEAVYQLFGGYIPQNMDSFGVTGNGLHVDYTSKIKVENHQEKVGDYLKKLIQNQGAQNKQQSTAPSVVVNPPSFSEAFTALKELASQSRMVSVLNDSRNDSMLCVDDTEIEESPRWLASSSSTSPTPIQSAISLQSPEGLSAMHQIALDLNLVYTMRRRDDGTPQFNFRSNTNDNCGRHVTLTETVDKIQITEGSDTSSSDGTAGLLETTDEWVKISVDQLLWAVRGKCQKCFSSSN